MKCASVLVVASLLVSLAASVALAEEVKGDPLGKVVELLQKLQEQLKRDAVAEKKSFDEYTSWCGTVARNTGFAIERSSSQKARLEAKITELSSDIELCNSKIGELAGTISAGTAELKNATAIRRKESADFVAGEQELLSVVETLNRAADVLERELKKQPAGLMQLDNPSLSRMIESLTAVVDAAAISVSDPQELSMLAQSEVEQAGGDVAPGEGSAKHSSDIVVVLKDLRVKAETQLKKLRQAEVQAKQNFAKLKTALDSQIAADSKDMAQEKAGKAQAQETEARASHELEVAVKELKSSMKELETTRMTCMRVAKDHEASVAARTDELQVLAQAVETLTHTTGGAAKQTYALEQASTASTVSEPAQGDSLGAEPEDEGFSLVQVAAEQSSLHHRRYLDAVAAQAVAMVENLADMHSSPALAQLASRITAAARYGASAGAGDPLAKVKQLIRDMVVKLEKEQQGDGSEKAYCDEELKKTDAKRREMEDKVSQLNAKLDQEQAHSAGLKEQVVQLQSELANIAKEQAELNAIRQEAHSHYVEAKSDLEKGLNGVRQALSVLREYYANAADNAALVQESGEAEEAEDAEFNNLMEQPAAPQRHSKSSGPGSGIIALLEMIESDFATNLAKIDLEESDAQASYEKVTQGNQVMTATKTKDATYRMQSSKAIDKSISEIASDRETLTSELAAVQEYDGKLRERCVGKPESFQEKKARRQAEITGLEDALEFLRRSAVNLVQRKLRGGPTANALEPAAAPRPVGAM